MGNAPWILMALLLLVVAIAMLIGDAEAVMGGAAIGAALLAGNTAADSAAADPAADSAAADSAADPAADPAAATTGGAIETVAAPNWPHPVGVALRDYARTLLEPGHALVGGAAEEGVAGGARGKTPAPRKPWVKYATWEALRADRGALHAYVAQRAAAIGNPDFDWGPVLAEIGPRLAERREYIGVVNAGRDGRTLQVTQVEASPVAAGEGGGETTFASVPAELVARHGARPGLFLFHTHPDDPRCCPYPSSHDLAAAIYFGTAERFAANAIISRYGVFVYSLDWPAYRAIKAAKDPQLAALNFSHDVVAAHEAVRSWSSWTAAEYLAFYARHRMFINSYPSPQMVGDARRFSYLGDLELPIDHELITDHSADIAAHRRASAKDAEKKRSETSLAPPLKGVARVVFD